MVIYNTMLHNNYQFFRGYSGRTPEAYVINFLGLFLVIFGWFVTFIVQKPEWKREPSSSDYQIQPQHD